MPVFAVVFGAVVLGERLVLREAAGLGLTLAVIALVLLAARARTSRSTEQPRHR